MDLKKKTHERRSEREFSTHGPGSVNSVMVVRYSYQYGIIGPSGPLQRILMNHSITVKLQGL